MTENLVPPIIKKGIPCPKCDGEMQHKKSWELRGKRTPDSKTTLMCHLYKCPSCNSTLRFPRIEERGKTKHEE